MKAACCIPGDAELDAIGRMRPEVQEVLREGARRNPRFAEDYLLPTLRKRDPEQAIIEDFSLEAVNADFEIGLGETALDRMSMSRGYLTPTQSAAVVSDLMAARSPTVPLYQAQIIAPTGIAADYFKLTRPGGATTPASSAPTVTLTPSAPFTPTVSTPMAPPPPTQVYVPPPRPRPPTGGGWYPSGGGYPYSPSGYPYGGGGYFPPGTGPSDGYAPLTVPSGGTGTASGGGGRGGAGATEKKTGLFAAGLFDSPLILLAVGAAIAFAAKDASKKGRGRKARRK